MAKKKKKQQKHSPVERYDYHRARMNSNKVSEGQRKYSRDWVDGFEDPHADFNHGAAVHELKRAPRNAGRLYIVGLKGYIAGTKARNDRFY